MEKDKGMVPENSGAVMCTLGVFVSVGHTESLVVWLRMPQGIRVHTRD
jgi:hypothetical protein